MRRATSIPLLHIADAALAEIESRPQPVRCVALLGTRADAEDAVQGFMASLLIGLLQSYAIASDVGMQDLLDLLGEHDGDTYALPPQTSVIRAAEPGVTSLAGDRPDFVVNCAAYTAVDDAEHDRLVAKADAEERAFWVRVIEKGDQRDGDLAHARALMARHGAMEAARAEALDWVAKAQAALALMPDHPLRGMLDDLAGYVVARIA